MSGEFWDGDDDYDDGEEVAMECALNLLREESRKRPKLGSKAYREKAKKIKLLAKFEKNIGPMLGCGADGEVYKYGKDRVIKFSHTYSERRMWVNMRKIFYKIKKYRPLNVARVYEYGQIDGNLYYVVMERLSSIRGQGANLLRRWVYEGGSLPQEKSKGERHSAYLFGVRVEGLERRLNLVHGDLHEGNVLCNKGGVWKFVDLEGFTYGNRHYVV